MRFFLIFVLLTKLNTGSASEQRELCNKVVKTFKNNLKSSEFIYSFSFKEGLHLSVLQAKELTNTNDEITGIEFSYKVNTSNKISKAILGNFIITENVFCKMQLLSRKEEFQSMKVSTSHWLFGLENNQIILPKSSSYKVDLIPTKYTSLHINLNSWEN